MNNTTAVLWYDKEVKDTLLEIQIFNSETEAVEFIQSSPAGQLDSYPKIVPGISVFIQNKEGHLIKK